MEFEEVRFFLYFFLLCLIIYKVITRLFLLDINTHDFKKNKCYAYVNLKNQFMSLESIFLVVAPICVFTLGVIVLPILVKPRKQSALPKRYVRGL